MAHRTNLGRVKNQKTISQILVRASDISINLRISFQSRFDSSYYHGLAIAIRMLLATKPVQHFRWFRCFCWCWCWCRWWWWWWWRRRRRRWWGLLLCQNVKTNHDIRLQSYHSIQGGYFSVVRSHVIAEVVRPRAF